MINKIDNKNKISIKFLKVNIIIEFLKGKNFLFIDGPGGTAITFLYKALLAYARSKKITVAVASSGIASLLLPGGRTAHYTFKIPIQLSFDSTCFLPRLKEHSELLRKADNIL